MDRVFIKGLQICCLAISLTAGGINIAYAAIYDFTGGPPGTLTAPGSLVGPNGETTPPLPNTTTGTQFANGDTVNIISGTTSTGSSSALPYTIGITDTATGAINGIAIDLNVNSGATLTYGGTASAGAAFFSSRQDSMATTSTIQIDGEVDAGTGLYGLYIANANANGQDTYTINISDTGSMSGAILTNNVNAVNLNLTGIPTVNGVINLGTKTAGLSTLTIGSPNTANFTPTESITNIGLLHITNSSTMTLNVSNTNISAVSVDSLSTFNINYALNGKVTSDGTINNNGTINLSANIAKTGGFIGTGTNNILEGAATGLTVATSTYQVTNHNAILQDVNNYGNINLTTAAFNLNNGGANTFKVIYGSDGYNPGYFPAGVYTLVTAAGAVTAPTFATVPDSTLFLAFSNLGVVSNKIQITLTRTPFNVYATTMLTQNIGSTLETIGTSNPSSSMIALLDAVEASTNQEGVEFALRQLAPLANAPFYGYQIQNESMYQVKLRLASLHDGSAHYFAGDIGKDNHTWLRGFGSYGNQDAKQDSLGYYASSGGVAAGFDRNLDDHYTLGAAFAYALSHVNDKVNPQSITDVKSYIGMVYGTYNFSDVAFLDWILGISINNYTANRLVNINSLYNQVASSSYDSQQISVLGLWSKNYEAFGFMQLTPQAQAQYTFVKQYAYNESDAPGANLSISRTNSDVVSLALGGIAAVPVLVDPSIIMPDLHFMVYYNPVIGKQNTTFSFIDGGGPMVSTMDLSRTALIIGAAFTIAVVERLEVKFNIDYEVADRFNGYMAYLNLRYFL